KEDRGSRCGEPSEEAAAKFDSAEGVLLTAHHLAPIHGCGVVGYRRVGASDRTIISICVPVSIGSINCVTHQKPPSEEGLKPPPLDTLTQRSYEQSRQPYAQGIAGQFLTVRRSSTGVGNSGSFLRRFLQPSQVGAPCQLRLGRRPIRATMKTSMHYRREGQHRH